MNPYEYEKALKANIALLDNMREIYTNDAQRYYYGKKVKVKYEEWDDEIGTVTYVEICDEGDIYLGIDFANDTCDDVSLEDVIFVDDEDETL